MTVYAWIWRRLPFGLPGKITGSLLLTAAVAALLWFVVFPWAEPLLPFDDVQVGQDGGAPGAPDVPGDGPGVPTGEPASPGLDEHDIPYDTGQNNPAPATTGNR